MGRRLGRWHGRPDGWSLMAIGQMRQTIFDDSNLSLFQQSLNDQFSQIAKVPFVNGTKIDDVELTTGQANTINHKLGREAVGYFVISNSANTVIWNDAFSGVTNIILT